MTRSTLPEIKVETCSECHPSTPASRSWLTRVVGWSGSTRSIGAQRPRLGRNEAEAPAAPAFTVATQSRMKTRVTRHCAPACTSRAHIGGQAVMEGVMMRGRHCWGLAVGSHQAPSCAGPSLLDDPGTRYPCSSGRWCGAWCALANRSAWGSRRSASRRISVWSGTFWCRRMRLARGEGPEAGPGVDAPDAASASRSWRSPWESRRCSRSASSWWSLWRVVKYFEGTFSNPFVFNLVEGLIRIAIFLAYIVGISLIPDLRRVFQYHGAEHKVIHAYESGEELDPEHARPLLHAAPPLRHGLPARRHGRGHHPLRVRGEAEPPLAGGLAHRGHPHSGRSGVRDHQVRRQASAWVHRPRRALARGSACSG